jgi:hypothetical protein
MPLVAPVPRVDPSPAASISDQAPSGTPTSELPRWLQIVVFTTILLTLTLLAMWGSAR